MTASFSILFITVALMVLPGAVFADEADEVIRAWMAERQIPGAALIIVKRGKILKAANYGYADTEARRPVADTTVFEIASMTKQFTAAAVLLLAEEGKLKLDDPVSKHLSDVPAGWRDITVRRLLDHTSGLYDDWDENNEYFQSKNSDQEFLEALKISKLKFAPGERHAYSCGPFIAGMIIAKLSGMPYSEFMRKRIFQPLGMLSTFVNGSGPAIKDAAIGYVLRDGKLQRGVQMSRTAHARADVGISTTARDLVKWLEAHHDARLLKDGSLREIFSFAKLNDGSTVPSGLGWWLNPIRGRPLRHHGGAFRSGFNSTINWYPKSDLAVILLANRFRSSANDMGHVIAGVYDPIYRTTSSRKVISDPKPARTKRLYEMLSQLSEGKLDLPPAAPVFPYRYYELTDWLDLLEGADGMKFLGCDNIFGRGDRIFGKRIKEICFYRMNGKDSRPVSFLLDLKGKALYTEPYEY
ncbi:MAG: serine hydrolase [bacterium]|nr:serine hydrolase [bacterium]